MNLENTCKKTKQLQYLNLNKKIYKICLQIFTNEHYVIYLKIKTYHWPCPNSPKHTC